MGDWTEKYSPGAPATYTAGAAITGGNVLYLSAAGVVSPTTGASAAVVGVASRDVASGELISVLRGGVQRCVASAAISVGAAVKSAASARVATMTIGTDAQDQLIGHALTAASNAGDVIDVQWEK